MKKETIIKIGGQDGIERFSIETDKANRKISLNWHKSIKSDMLLIVGGSEISQFEHNVKDILNIVESTIRESLNLELPS